LTDTSLYIYTHDERQHNTATQTLSQYWWHTKKIKII